MVNSFFDAPLVTIAEAVGSPNKQRLSVEGTVSEVSII